MSDNRIEPILVDERTAAKFLCMSEKALYDARMSGDLPYVRVGRKGTGIRYLLDDLREYAKRHRVCQVAAVPAIAGSRVPAVVDLADVAGDEILKSQAVTRSDDHEPAVMASTQNSDPR